MSRETAVVRAATLGAGWHSGQSVSRGARGGPPRRDAPKRGPVAREGAHCPPAPPVEATRRTSGRPVTSETEPNGTSCDQLTINDRTTEFKLRSVACQLTHLIQDPTLQTINAQAFDKDYAKIASMLRLYLRLLNLAPPDNRSLELLNRLNNSLATNKSTSSGLLDSRQQVLRYIENLNGYCDSIDLLRCTLKSAKIISVMGAFDDILQRLRKQQTAGTGDLQPVAKQLLDRDTDFRIVREWTV